MKDKLSEKLNSIWNRLKDLASQFAGVFKDYPVTMAMILAAAVFSAVLHLDHDNEVKKNCEKILQFAFCMAAQGFAVEELFRGKLKRKIAGFVISVIISALFVYIGFHKGAEIAGMDIEMVKEVWLRFCIVYGISLLAAVIFHIKKRLSEGFEVYCTRAFLALVRSYFLYGLFAVGLAVLLFIFNELIFDTDDLLECLEVFLAISFLAAITIRALGVKHEKPGRFAGICEKFALIPMLIAAFAIIYIYMVKIFVTDDIPSNSVFGILTGLFVSGVLIWTMGHDICSDRRGIGGMSFILPYVYIPFIFLQSWSILIRIRQYGFTAQRYFGIVLIIFEILYFVLYITGRIIKKELIGSLLILLALAALICLFAPRLSFDDVVIASQTKRAKNILSLKDISRSKGSELSSAWDTIRDVSYKGKNAAEEKFSEAEKAVIDEQRSLAGSSYSHTAYMRAGQYLAGFDISGYSRIYETGIINWEYGDISNKPYTVYVSTLGDSNEDSADFYLNVKGLAEHFISQYEAGNGDDYSLGKYRLIKIDDSRDLFIKDITVTYNEDEPEETEIDFSGYVLER